jgi:hypothetical protein
MSLPFDLYDLIEGRENRGSTDEEKREGRDIPGITDDPTGGAGGGTTGGGTPPGGGLGPGGGSGATLSDLLNILNQQQNELGPDDFGFYTIPGTDPTFRSGLNYARSIAGGIPMSQVIAPGVSYSPEMPMGYTQAEIPTTTTEPTPPVILPGDDPSLYPPGGKPDRLTPPIFGPGGIDIRDLLGGYFSVGGVGGGTPIDGSIVPGGSAGFYDTDPIDTGDIELLPRPQDLLPPGRTTPFLDGGTYEYFPGIGGGAGLEVGVQEDFEKYEIPTQIPGLKDIPIPTLPPVYVRTPKNIETPKKISEPISGGTRDIRDLPGFTPMPIMVPGGGTPIDILPPEPISGGTRDIRDIPTFDSDILKQDILMSIPQQETPSISDIIKQEEIRRGLLDLELRQPTGGRFSIAQQTPRGLF